MSGRRKTGDHIILLLLLSTYQITGGADAGAPSPPKNLVNLLSQSSNDNASNTNATSSNQFQNEYQYRQAAHKTSTSADRYKSSATTPDSTVLGLSNWSSALESSNSSSPEYYYHGGMTNVPDCSGRLMLHGPRGFITDGPGHYQINLQCVWLIDSGRTNATIRLQLHQFNTECNYDFLYIFDGDSIYSPLVAALSGDMKDFSSAFVSENMISFQDNKSTSSNNNSVTNHSSTQTPSDAVLPQLVSESRPLELKTTSGKAFIYFHSDTAQSMPGFYLTYNVDACPLDCSNKGECDYSDLKCKCNTGYHGDGCQYISCPNNCTSTIHGRCDESGSCICMKGYHGPDCSRTNGVQMWSTVHEQVVDVPARAHHQAIVVNQTMWIIGGKTQSFSNPNLGIFKRKPTKMVMSFDLVTKSWSNWSLDGTTGIDHLAELSGHSVATDGGKVYIYGGMAMNNSVLDAFTVFDTETKATFSLAIPGRVRSLDEELDAPVAAVGHSAIISDKKMYIFLGYNPLYGYLNFVQRYDIVENTWSLLDRKGSSVSGRIGHSSTLDTTTKTVFVYGGHNAVRTSRLYAFDLRSESWTFLQPGPSPRYYHSAAIINRQLIIFGGNSYGTTHQSDQCFHRTYVTYDLACFDDASNITANECPRKCWHSIDDNEPGVLKRHGHSIVTFERDIVLFGGFNGILMNDVRHMNVGSCEGIYEESDCTRSKLALNCRWNSQDRKCEHSQQQDAPTISEDSRNSTCPVGVIHHLQNACEGRETCSDCLNTNIGCVWCGPLTSRCQYATCRSSNAEPVTSVSACFNNSEVVSESTIANDRLNSSDQSNGVHFNPQIDYEMDCKVDNCWLCHTRPHCLWHGESCVHNSPAPPLPTPSSYSSSSTDTTGMDFPDSRNIQNSSAHSMRKLDSFNKSILSALTSRFIGPMAYHECELPCFKRSSCDECTSTKCIWCSTTEQCIDSTAYFAYHAMGQCMHYVAHSYKCPIAFCSDIDSCYKCLTNPRCGWLNDISNTGKGRCIEGNSSGPTQGSFMMSADRNSSALIEPMLSNWHYTSCPLCQCNGHSYCKSNSSVCAGACQDNTDGPYCDRCIQGYYGDPLNGGSCRPCRCNGHAQTCNKETGRCYCSTKGIIGNHCQRCDEKNYYIGDPSSPGNGTCYYNLTTDFQYTFNMSKPEDHFYSVINFINLPPRKDSDVDFTIACSRLALVNISAGTSYRNRKPIHTNLECGSFRLRFIHERHQLGEANFSFFVHVHKFQTPFILQIAFSQHRTLYLPQLFFTFSSCFLFFFGLAGMVWKMKHEYDLYVRRQRQYIEMEQMASRPFSMILLEMFKSSGSSKSKLTSEPVPEPTPISFEPCFSNNVGVFSVFVQLPGRPNLAIGSALVSLRDESGSSCDEESASNKQQEKDCTTVKDV